MQKITFYSIVIFLSVSILSAEAIGGSYTLPITRNGVTHHMVAYNYWSGEYPKPVINVKHNQNRWVQIEGYASLRKSLNREVCSIRAGIYHPWSKEKISIIDYYSIIPRVDYVAKKNTLLDDQKIRKGDKLENEIYIAEGSCSYLLNKRREIVATCIDDPTVFRRIETPSHSSEQWLYLKCREGYKVFVQDTDLLSQPNIKRGAISGYGEVTNSTMK